MDRPPPPPDDAIEHLWNAAHEFLRAMRALVDAADEFVDGQRNRPAEDASEPRVHRIDIDADADAS
jgi:hypothetical protein